MILKTGNKLAFGVWRIAYSLTANRYPLTAKRGFTLIEAMVAAAVFSLGTVLVYESFFISLDSFNYCADYLDVVSSADDKLWRAEDNLSRTGSLTGIDTAGSFIKRNKKFGWNLSYDSIEGMDNLYRINMVMSWKEGRRSMKISRTAYATHKAENTK